MHFFIREIRRNAQCTATRDDRHLVHGVAERKKLACESMSNFVIGCCFFLAVTHDHALALNTHQDLVLGVLEVVHRHIDAIASCREQGSFIDEVRQVSATHPRSTLGNHFKVHILRNRNLACVDAENAKSAIVIRTVDHDLTVETTRTQQRRIQDVGAVCCCDDDDA